MTTGSTEVNLRGVLRWLLLETDADAVALLQVMPGAERLDIEPAGLADGAVADLAVRTRAAMVSLAAGGPGVEETSTSRWLGVGGSKLLFLTGASPLTTSEPVRLARFAIEWLAGSWSGNQAHPFEDLARRVPGVAWAEMAPEGVLRVLACDSPGSPTAAEMLQRVLAGELIRWIDVAPHDTAERARLVEVTMTETDAGPSAEVVLVCLGETSFRPLKRRDLEMGCSTVGDGPGRTGGTAGAGRLGEPFKVPATLHGLP